MKKTLLSLAIASLAAGQSVCAAVEKVYNEPDSVTSSLTPIRKTREAAD